MLESVKTILEPATYLSIRTAYKAFRRARLRLQRPHRINAYLSTHPVRKLHIGCGQFSLAGWLNGDYDPQGLDAIFLDARRAIPLADRSFDYVFSEHMIEHIPLAHGETLLRECHRILKPGGRIRIATPDLTRFVDFLRKQDPEGAGYAEWVYAGCFANSSVRSPAMVVNNIMSNFGHVFVYDEATLRATLAVAGFVDVMRREIGESDDPHLQGLERHADIIGDANNRFETMILEAVRPAPV